MTSRSPHPILFYDSEQRLRWAWRLLWNAQQRRPRLPIRLVVGFILIFLFAGIGNSYSPRIASGDGALISVINSIVGTVPLTIGILTGVYLASRWIDRRWITGLGFDTDHVWWRELVVGIALGLGITALSVIVALLAGWNTLSSFQLTNGPLQWLLLAIGAGIFQLLVVVPEEVFVRGYLITNITEGLDGLSAVPRVVAAGTGVLLTSVLFYYTHTTGRSEVTIWFGLMAGSLAIVLGIAYILTGNLALPIGLHFGVNFAGVLFGTNQQPASVLRLAASGPTISNSPLTNEVVIVRIIGGALSVGVFTWWCWSRDGQLRIAPSVTVPALRWRGRGNEYDSNR